MLAKWELATQKSRVIRMRETRVLEWAGSRMIDFTMPLLITIFNNLLHNLKMSSISKEWITIQMSTKGL